MTPIDISPINLRLEFLAGGGETGARMRPLDWTKTPLGPVEHRPQSLRTRVEFFGGIFSIRSNPGKGTNQLDTWAGHDREGRMENKLGSIRKT